jgi:hypothetical protein
VPFLSLPHLGPTTIHLWIIFTHLLLKLAFALPSSAQVGRFLRTAFSDRFGLLNHEVKARKAVMDTVSFFIPQIQVVALIDSFIHLHLYDILTDVIVPF